MNMIKINLFNKYENCCSCGACIQICPKSAITLVDYNDPKKCDTQTERKPNIIRT